MNAGSTPRRLTRMGATTEPTAKAAIESPSCTPNTRAKTSSSTLRCSSVRAVTSKKLLPIPAMPSRTTAAAGPFANAMSAMGTPITATPAKNAGASRSRPIKVTVAAAPNRPPTPTAAESTPGPEGPMAKTL